MKKMFFLFLLAFTCVNQLFSQQNPASAITHEKYFENPTQYLSHLDTAKIGSNTLIDRVLYDSTILNVNGLDKVTSIDYPSFASIYTNLKYSNTDTSAMHDFDKLIEHSNSYRMVSGVNMIGIIYYAYKRVRQEAIDSLQLIQENDRLNDANATIQSYASQRAVSASCFSHNIYGDQIQFMTNDLFYFTNNVKESLHSIQIDFGNGEGFREAPLGEVTTVNYTGGSNYIEIKVKLVLENVLTNELKSLYAHFSVYRQTSSLIPLPEINITNPSGGLAQPSQLISPDATIYYPTLLTGPVSYDFCYLYTNPLTGAKIPASCLSQAVWVWPSGIKKTVTVQEPLKDQYTLEVSFLMNPENKSGKLRRPLMMVDGFDPGNQRNYFSTFYSHPDEMLPYERDFRGLFQLLNGNPSPWEDGHRPEAEFAQGLRDNGYDIIFVNFIYGAGDIPTNAQLLRDFLNNIINSSQFRDNKTEELVLVGPSMGGLITRLTLTNMEQNGEQHYVKSWLSFDSPQKGANIPLALQHAVSFAKNIPTQGKKMQQKLDKLNSPTAQQLLMEHYTRTGTTPNPSSAHTNLQNLMNQMGFPIISKNYSITSGGVGPLYMPTPDKIIDFKYLWPLIGMNGWSRNDNASTDLFYGHAGDIIQNIDVRNTIDYSSGPGGFLGTLYSLNFNSNQENVPMSNIPTKWSTFIPTSSAFGMAGNTIEEKRAMVAKDWSQFTNCNDVVSGKIITPFDDIFGNRHNEEHVNITVATKDHVLNNWLNEDFKNFIHPVVRLGAPIHEKSGKPSAYVVQEEMEFAGHNNTFTFESTADANVRAGKTIRFSPGFRANNGCKMVAKIEMINNNKVLKSMAPKQNTLELVEKANYLKESPFVNLSYDYSDKMSMSLAKKENITFSVFPNPTSNLVYLAIDGDVLNTSQIEVFNSIGQQVLSSSINQKGTYELNMAEFDSGIYYILLRVNSEKRHVKIVKM